MPKTLYKRQREVLEFIKQYIQANQSSPTLQQIADHFGLSSLATVHAHIKRLEKKGYLIKTKNQERGLVLTDPSVSLFFREISEIPLRGNCQPGGKIQTTSTSQTIPVPIEIIGNTAALALRCSSSIAAPVGAQKGDLLFFIETSDITDNAVCLAHYLDAPNKLFWGTIVQDSTSSSGLFALGVHKQQTIPLHELTITHRLALMQRAY
ncbi:MAG TPA: HTH domain-containing protein [Candidatus Wirthbacteria bacterium]|nr:HTH domain-containing protein [Candidatus Wirthbacteria bacterium]